MTAKARHAFPAGPTVKGRGGGGGEQASSLISIAKRAVEFPQVLASTLYSFKIAISETVGVVAKNIRVCSQFSPPST